MAEDLRKWGSEEDLFKDSGVVVRCCGVIQIFDNIRDLSCGAGFEEYRVLDSTESREESMLRSRHFIFKFASY